MATPRPQTRARLARKVVSVIGSDDWVRVRLGRVGGGLVASPLPRGAGVLTSLVRADGLLVIPTEVEGHHAGRGGRHLAAAQPSRDRGHDRRHRLPRPHPRPRRLRAAYPRPQSHPGLEQRRLARRTDRAARRALPSRRLAPARARDRRVHDPLRRADARGPGHRHRPARAPRAGADRRARQPARPRRDQPTSPGPGCATSTASGARAPVSCSTTSYSAPASTLAAISGYSREEPTHLAVAAAIAAGRADCGMGVQAAARAFELDFVPVAQEPYDLVLERATAESDLLAPLWALHGDRGVSLRRRGARRLRHRRDGPTASARTPLSRRPAPC